MVESEPGGEEEKRTGDKGSRGLDQPNGRHARTVERGDSDPLED